MNFGADKPGIVPAGTDESTVDIMAYENVMAVVETTTGTQQLVVGTLVKVDKQLAAFGCSSLGWRRWSGQ